MEFLSKIFMPSLSSLSQIRGITVVNCLVLIVIASMTAFCISKYAIKEWKGSKIKVTFGFVAITISFLALLLLRFGCGATAVRGCIFCLILLLASYSDIKKRECSDWLHVMILITAFVGCDFANLPNMLASALVVGGIMLLTVLITNCDIGGADIKCAIASSFLLGIERSLVALFVGMFLALICNAFKDKKERKQGFPVIPYLAVGYLGMYLI